MVGKWEDLNHWRGASSRCRSRRCDHQNGNRFLRFRVVAVKIKAQRANVFISRKIHAKRGFRISAVKFENILKSKQPLCSGKEARTIVSTGGYRKGLHLSSFDSIPSSKISGAWGENLGASIIAVIWIVSHSFNEVTAANIAVGISVSVFVGICKEDANGIGID